jgi:hypothetical protein
MKQTVAILAVLALAHAALAAPGAETAPPARPKPAADPTPKAETLTAKVVSVAGPAQKMVAGKDKKWSKLVKDEQLGSNTLIRTGLGAKVVLDLAGRGEVVINNVTKVGLSDLAKRGKAARAKIGLKYGTIRAAVDAAEGPSEVQVKTPVATLSVRGSIANCGALAGTSKIIGVVKGKWQAATGAGTRAKTLVLKAGQGTTGQATPFLSLLMAQRDPGIGGAGLSPLEKQILVYNRLGARVVTINSGFTGTTKTIGLVLPTTLPGPNDDEPGFP